MKPRLFLAFAAILAVTSVAGGCSDTPMAPAPEEAGLGAPARRDVSPDPLRVEMLCHFYGWALAGNLYCEATASGGTGTGYTFYWSSPTYAHYTAGAYSSAWVDCSDEWYEQVPSYFQGSVTLGVVDSGSGYAEVTTGGYQCAYGARYYDYQNVWYYSGSDYSDFY